MAKVASRSMLAVAQKPATSPTTMSMAAQSAPRSASWPKIGVSSGSRRRHRFPSTHSASIVRAPAPVFKLHERIEAKLAPTSPCKMLRLHSSRPAMTFPQIRSAGTQTSMDSSAREAASIIAPSNAITACPMPFSSSTSTAPGSFADRKANSQQISDATARACASACLSAHSRRWSSGSSSSALLSWSSMGAAAASGSRARFASAQ
mmetsp:Transcript_3578/g.14102  ORF Transcript_3578/g.14102 Transcript_3578/m.14102 type:complete len:206 (-) Transcript_3578:677-1294(-)